MWWWIVKDNKLWILGAWLDGQRASAPHDIVRSTAETISLQHEHHYRLHQGYPQVMRTWTSRYHNCESRGGCGFCLNRECVRFEDNTQEGVVPTRLEDN
ncbi:hypothetical protein BGX38DRAFT_773898 [Terfezia claveryi]|nr:hypothetical protein BGX38DRAFT_773898 [Terfezia claveryi]